MVFLIYCILIIAGYFFSLPKLFALAGKESKYGYIPVYRNMVWLNIVGMKSWRVFFLFVPGVNVLMLSVMNYELARAFDKKEFKDLCLAIFVPFVFFPILARDEKAKFVGPTNWKDTKKPWWMEWRDAAVYATIAATTLNLFTFQAYTIPSPSMEGSLLTGDYLFVSKFHYGARMPNTPLGVPFTQNRLPGGMVPSYLEWVQLPYFRLPGFSDIQRNDPMVFNFPANDTFIVDEEKSTHTYYDMLTQRAWQTWIGGGGTGNFENVKDQYISQARKAYASEYGISTRPVDRRENYVKRCVALPGDVLEIVDGQLMINGAQGENPTKMQHNYWFLVSARFGLTQLEMQGIRPDDVKYEKLGAGREKAIVPTTKEVADNLAKLPNVVENKYIMQNYKKGYDYSNRNLRSPRYLPIYPNDVQYDWTEDNFGPLKLPESGATVELNKLTLPLYRRIIEAYECHDLKVVGDDILIDGKKATTYQFAMNYYWLMGDNRGQSADSRFWGFVPEDHVIGKPTLIWFSKEAGQDIRWDRMFTIPE